MKCGASKVMFFHELLNETIRYLIYFKKIFQECPKNEGRQRQAHKIDDFFTRLRNTTNSPTLGKISTNMEYV